MRKLTISEINAIELTEKEQKSNDAFVILTKAIKFYNEGWVPTNKDYGYMVYSSVTPYFGQKVNNGSNVYLGDSFLYAAFACSPSIIGARLAIKNIEIAKFMEQNYKQEYKQLFMED